MDNSVTCKNDKSQGNYLDKTDRTVFSMSLNLRP